MSDPKADTPAIKKQMVSPQHAAEMLDVSRYTVRRWIKTGKLPAVKFSSSTIRIRVADVERLIAERAA
jgi:excisionase family DNA binding protein